MLPKSIGQQPIHDSTLKWQPASNFGRNSQIVQQRKDTQMRYLEEPNSGLHKARTFPSLFRIAPWFVGDFMATFPPLLL